AIQLEIVSMSTRMEVTKREVAAEVFVGAVEMPGAEQRSRNGAEGAEAVTRHSYRHTSATAVDRADP
ncbi:MAG: hypothetical protein KDE24_31890, partial [Caldilinea sp.]|nr:hypothetical protein [Caldilinea sp.]